MIALWILFFAAWGFAVVKVTRYLGDTKGLGKTYHRIDRIHRENSR